MLETRLDHNWPRRSEETLCLKDPQRCDLNCYFTLKRLEMGVGWWDFQGDVNFERCLTSALSIARSQPPLLTDILLLFSNVLPWGGRG